MAKSMNRRSFCAAAATLLLTACGGQTDQAAPEPQATEEPAQEADQTEAEPQEEAPAQDEQSEDADTAAKTLVVYYSRADESYGNGGLEWLEVGHTKVMAGYIAETLAADQYEIVPATPYPEGYNDCCDVALQEQSDDARPAIANPLPDLTPYQQVFIGCPIWWGEEPMIVRTFLEGVDLSGKVVVPFTTHGGSGLGSVPSNVASFAPNADLRDGHAVAGTDVEAQHDAIVDWAKGFALA